MSGLFMGRGSACNWCEDDSSPSESDPSVSSSSVSLSSLPPELSTSPIACGACSVFPRLYRVAFGNVFAGGCEAGVNNQSYIVDLFGAQTPSPFMVTPTPCDDWVSSDSPIGLTSVVGVCDNPTPTRARVTLRSGSLTLGSVFEFYVILSTINRPGSGPFGSRSHEEWVWKSPNITGTAQCLAAHTLSFHTTKLSFTPLASTAGGADDVTITPI